MLELELEVDLKDRELWFSSSDWRHGLDGRSFESHFTRWLSQSLAVARHVACRGRGDRTDLEHSHCRDGRVQPRTTYCQKYVHPAICSKLKLDALDISSMA